MDFEIWMHGRMHTQIWHWKQSFEQLTFYLCRRKPNWRRKSRRCWEKRKTENFNKQLLVLFIYSSQMNFSSVLAPKNFSLSPDEFIQQQTSDKTDHHLCDYELDKIFWILNGVLGLAIILGNTFTCAVFLSRSHLRENYMNIYLISLGVADISMAILVVPGYAAFCSGCTYTWSNYCWFFGGARDISLPATVLNLMAITYDRHLAVLRPLHYASTMTKRKVFGILLVVWIT